MVENGILYSSGLIAGEGLVGIMLAVFAIIPRGEGSLADMLDMGNILGNVGSILCFAILLGTMFWFTGRNVRRQNAKKTG